MNKHSTTDFLRSLLDHSLDMIISVDSARNITEFNPAAVETFLYSRSEILGKPVDMLYADPAEALKVRAALQQEGRFRGEVTNRKKSGEVFVAYLSASTLGDAEGNLKGHMGISRDITERTRAEEALKASRDYLDKLTNSMWDAVFSVRMPERVIEWANDSFRLFGYEPSECIGKDTAFLYADKDDFLDFGNQLEDAMAAGKDVLHADLLLKRKSGEHFPAEVTVAFHRENDEVVSVISILRDITERKRTEKELRQLSRAVEQSPVSIIITDTKGDIEYVNPMFVESTGYAEEEILGQNPRILNSGEHPEESYREMWETICSGEVWHGEFHNKKKNGELYWEAASISPIRDGDGAISGFVAVKEDITERKEMEAALRKTMADLERFNKAAVGRELRMIELKREVNELAKRLGEAAPYDVSFAEDVEPTGNR